MSVNNLEAIMALSVGSRYSMSLFPKAIYGDKLNKVTLNSITTARGVRLFGVIAQEEHDKVYSQLPVGTPDDPALYPWYVFEDSQGNPIVIGQSWIDASTIVSESNDIVHTFRITGNDAIPLRVHHALAAIGIYEYTYTK